MSGFSIVFKGPVPLLCVSELSVSAGASEGAL